MMQEDFQVCWDQLIVCTGFVKNCPTAWSGQYKGKENGPTVVLEAIASYDLWIWHAYFGIPGSNSDINVLDRSPLTTCLMLGRAPSAEFTINGRTHSQAYYPSDGINKDYSVFIKTISHPVTAKHKLVFQFSIVCSKRH